LDHGGKANLVIKYQKTWLEYILVSMFCGRQTCEHESGYLAEAISKHRVEGEAWFLFTIYIKCMKREMT
jgi:hypothetical protein